MPITTGLSGNEIFCLAQKKYIPGNIVVGNSVHALGVGRMLGATLKAITGGEIEAVTKLIEEGRESAYKRMMHEAENHGAVGVTGVTSQLIRHGTNIEFLSIGSAIHEEESSQKKLFSTAADGQELYAQLDAGYAPIGFVFGNVAYALGLRRGIWGTVKTLARGEIKEFSDLFNHTRHLALARLVAHAKSLEANAVLGIQTTILPFGGTSEMLMLGTASHHDQINFAEEVVTSDMTNVEMWNMASLGYVPIRLLLGTSVYSLGFIGGVTTFLKSFVRGEIHELTRLIYDARENALDIINKEAKTLGADDVVGIKTYVYELGGGLIEFLAIGTAIKKVSQVTVHSPQLPPQAIVVDKDTFYASTDQNKFYVNMNTGDKPIDKQGWLLVALFSLGIIGYLLMRILRWFHLI